MRRILPLLLLTSTACGEELAEPGHVVLSSGHEPDVWSADPPVTHGTVAKEDDSGNSVQIETFEPPLEAFSLGEGKVAHFVVTGYDASEVVRAKARSLLVSPAGFAGSSLPLFVQRAGSFARPPGALSTNPGDRPPAVLVLGRFLLLAGPGAQIDGYDFGAWQPVEPPPPLDCPSPPCTIRTLAVVAGSLTLAIGDTSAFWFDPIAGGLGDAPKPAGLASWADLAGGQSVVATDGTAYVVGGTREQGATSAVVQVAVDGTLTAFATSSARAGAAALWVAGRGLVLVGGGDAQAAGAELLADGTKAFMPLPYPADPVTRAGVVALDAARVLRIGGRDSGGKAAPTVEISLGCGTGCAPKTVGDPFDAARVHAVSIGPERVLAVGESASGETVAARFAEGKLAPIPLREARSGATVFDLPSGHAGVAGGTHLDGSPAATLELFIE